jgi:hypothetical protein
MSRKDTAVIIIRMATLIPSVKSANLETPARDGTYAISKTPLACQLQHYVIRPSPLLGEFLPNSTRHNIYIYHMKTNLRSTVQNKREQMKIKTIKDM